MARLAYLVGILVLFIPGNALADSYYSVSVAAIPAGPVPTAAFYFRFNSANLLMPTPLGGSFTVSSEPGFALNGTPMAGFILTGIGFMFDPAQPGPCFYPYFLNSAMGEVLIMFVCMPAAPTSDGTYALGVISALFLSPAPTPTTPAVVGNEGVGALSVTPFFLPFGYQYCPAAAVEGRLNSTLGRGYDPFTESCVDGVVEPLVPPPGNLICAPGVNGLGGFYLPSSSYCDFGAIVPFGFDLCLAGPYGLGGFYQSSKGEGCDHGVVLPAGDAYCHRGPKGPGGLYIEVTEYCDKGKVGSYFPHP
jgi:hypothetical protein